MASKNSRSISQDPEKGFGDMTPPLTCAAARADESKLNPGATRSHDDDADVGSEVAAVIDRRQALAAHHGDDDAKLGAH